MRKLHKIILFIISLIGLLFSVAMLSLFYYIPVVSDSVNFAYGVFPLLHEAFAVFILFVSICFLLLILAALFVPKASNYLIVLKNGGKLQFSKQTVESTVRYSFADIEGVNLYDVKASLGRVPEKTKVFVKLSLAEPANLVELTETIKNRIEAALLSSLGVTAQSINIKVIELARNQNPQPESIAKPVSLAKPENSGEPEEPAANSRVI